MSKKKGKSKGKSKGRRRRSVGALNLNSPVVKLLAVGAGFFAHNMINQGMVDKIWKGKTTNVPGSNPPQTEFDPQNTAKAVVQVGLGGLLLMNKKGGKLVSMATTVVGGALAGAGLRRALKQMGVLKGYQNTPVIGKHRMAGYQNTPVIGHNGAPAQLQGTPGQLQGYRVNGYNSQGSGVMGSVISDNANGSGISNGSGYMG